MDPNAYLTSFRQFPITRTMRGPFHLTKVPVSLKRRVTSKKYGCPHRAVADLRKLKLKREEYYGAEVTDDNGVKLAELEV
jgi:hypothetical protein